MLLCGAGCCLWTRGFSGHRARPWGRAAPWAARTLRPSAPRASIGALARCPAPPPTGTAVRPSDPSGAAARSPSFRSLRHPPHRRGLRGCCSARCPDAQLWLPTSNFACNSPATISNSEFTALKSQRFQALLNLQPIELHATFEEGQAPRPTSAVAHVPRSSAFRSLRCRGPKPVLPISPAPSAPVRPSGMWLGALP